MEAIQTIHLTKAYGRARGILDLNLSVMEGDFFGFIGPNGAGKSTTIRTLLGLITPTNGSAQVLGRNIRKDRTAILAEVGYMPSEAMFYSGLRVRELLRLSAKLRGRDCTKQAAALCDRLGLDTSRKIQELSLGNRKKVSIVCAMQHHPRLYILDEPTSGLDPLIQREFYTLLQERNRDGATIFLSSHVLSEVQRYCKHTAVIREGQLLTVDSVENLGHTGAKRVTLRGVHQPLPLEGVRDWAVKGDTATFLYSGNLPALMQALSTVPLADVTITEPALEEVFLHYYTKEGESYDTAQA